MSERYVIFFLLSVIGSTISTFLLCTLGQNHLISVGLGAVKIKEKCLKKYKMMPLVTTLQASNAT
jgi:hypothetical protein